MSECTKERFLKDVRDHKLTVIRDDGLYRHIRMAVPGSYCESFDIITWPGYLCYTGDMGTYVFTRLADMFEFFRGDDRRPLRVLDGIDRRYWAEKVEGRDRSGIKEFCEDTFNRVVMSELVSWIRGHRDTTSKDERRELWDAVVSEVIHADGDSGGYRKQCAAHDFRHQVNDETYFYFSDFWEHNVERYTYRFTWCCFALRWAIAHYDVSTANRKQAA